MAWWLASAGGCVTDHDALARRPPSDAGGDGDAAGAGGSGGTGGQATGGSDAGGGTGNTGAAPTGPSELTLVHGLADVERIAFCFSVAGEPVGAPLPEEGLGYGQSVALAAIDGADFEADAVLPIVIGGELDRISGLDCEAALEEVGRFAPAPDTGLDGGVGDAGEGDGGEGGAAGGGAAGAGGAGGGGAAGEGAGEGDAGAGGASAVIPEPPALQARPLALLPAGTLSLGHSSLLVVSGCLGAAERYGSRASMICGQPFAGQSASSWPVLVGMSRTREFGRVGLQVVHAARAGEAVQIGASDEAGTSLSLTTKLGFGQIGPDRPRLAGTREDYLLQTPTLEVYADSSRELLFKTSFEHVLARGGLDDLENGTNYTLILIGPSPSYREEGPWNPPALTIVQSDPPL